MPVKILIKTKLVPKISHVLPHQIKHMRFFLRSHQENKQVDSLVTTICDPHIENKFEIIYNESSNENMPLTQKAHFLFGINHN